MENAPLEANGQEGFGLEFFMDAEMAPVAVADELPAWIGGIHEGVGGCFAGEHNYLSNDSSDVPVGNSGLTSMSSSDQRAAMRAPWSDSEGLAMTEKRKLIPLRRDLTKLLNNITDQIARIPPLSFHGDWHVCRAVDSAPGEEGHVNAIGKCVKCYGRHVFCIDQTLQHTEEMVDLYTRLIKLPLQGQDSAARNTMQTPEDTPTNDRNSQSAHFGDLIDPTTEISGQPTTERSQHMSGGVEDGHPADTEIILDDTTILLMIACHSAINDLWYDGLPHLHKKKAKSTSNGPGLASQCSGVKIGSHKLSTRLATTVYASLMADLGQKLAKAAGELVEALAATNNDSGTKELRIYQHQSKRRRLHSGWNGCRVSPSTAVMVAAKELLAESEILSSEMQKL